MAAIFAFLLVSCFVVSNYSPIVPLVNAFAYVPATQLLSAVVPLLFLKPFT